MTEVSKSRRQTVRVVYAHYDYTTKVKELRYGNAVIGQNGAAMIQLNMFGVLKRRAGEYVLADQFQHEWKRCVKKRAEEMAQEIAKNGNSNN